MAGKMVRCYCSNFEFITDETTVNGQPEIESYTTNCTQATTRVFAQGHDAKLVGFLVRAELAGEEIRINNGGVVHSWGNAVLAALAISEPLAAKAQAQLDAARARIAKREAREAAKTARASAKKAAAVEPTHRHATIKVGRWEYRAAIEIATGDLIYTNKKGQDIPLKRGEYKEV